MPRMRQSDYKILGCGIRIAILPDERATTASGIEPGLGRQPPLLINWRSFNKDMVYLRLVKEK